MPIPAGRIVQVAYPVLSGDFLLGSLVPFCSTEPRFWHHVRKLLLSNFLTETLSKRANSVAHLTNFSFEFLNKIFREGASLLLLDH